MQGFGSVAGRWLGRGTSTSSDSDDASGRNDSDRLKMTTVKLYVRAPRPPYAVTPIRVDRDVVLEKALKKYCRMFRYYYPEAYWEVNGWVLFPEFNTFNNFSHIAEGDTIRCGFIGE